MLKINEKKFVEWANKVGYDEEVIKEALAELKDCKGTLIGDKVLFNLDLGNVAIPKELCYKPIANLDTDKMTITTLERCFLRDNLDEDQVLQCAKIINDYNKSNLLIIGWSTLNIEGKLGLASKLCQNDIDLIPTMIKVVSILSETLEENI